MIVDVAELLPLVDLLVVVVDGLGIRVEVTILPPVGDGGDPRQEAVAEGDGGHGAERDVLVVAAVEGDHDVGQEEEDEEGDYGRDNERLLFSVG